MSFQNVYSRKAWITNWTIVWLIIWMNRFKMFLQLTVLRISRERSFSISSQRNNDREGIVSGWMICNNSIDVALCGFSILVGKAEDEYLIILCEFNNRLPPVHQSSSKLSIINYGPAPLCQGNSLQLRDKSNHLSPAKVNNCEL